MEANLESEIHKDDGQETELIKGGGQETEAAAKADLPHWRIIRARAPAFQWAEVEGDFKRKLTGDPIRTQLAEGRQGRYTFTTIKKV